jgi:hypothetical protein
MIRDGREEGCSHTNEPQRNCKDGCGRGSIERHEFLELSAYQVPVAARMKHNAANAHMGLRGPTRAHSCFRSPASGGIWRAVDRRGRGCRQAADVHGDRRRGWPMARAL